MSRGRKREHYQWNLDIIGEDSVAAEAEVVATAVAAMTQLGFSHDDFRVRFSSRALLGDLLLKLGIAADLHAPVFLALDKRGKADDDEIGRLLENAGIDAGRIGDIRGLLSIESFEDALGVLQTETAASSRLRRFMDILERHGIADVVTFDIGIVRGLAYYTGLVFEAFDRDRRFRAIFGGGRYDNLLADIGGKPATGVGLGFGDVVVAEQLADRTGISVRRGPKVAVGFMEDAQQNMAVSVAATLRAERKSVDLALHPEKAKHFFSRVGKSGAREAIYIGPDDLAKGTLRVKDLASREEREISMTEPDAS
jgi:histidyl-tRNA synthetase